MQFKDIPGQQAVKTYFQDIRKADKIPHAMLITGNPGTGKLALAIAFASYLLCNNPEHGDSCGVCPACIKNNKIIHPDLHFAFPVVRVQNQKREDVTSNNFLPQWRSLILENIYFDYNTWLTYVDAGNDQGNINKKECIEIIQKLSLASFGSKQKVLILWKAEQLGDIGNTLLKLIEEPPSDTIIILIADNPNMVLNTIKSRCQMVKTIAFEDREITSYLEEYFESRDWHNVVRLADGNLHKAVTLTSGDNINYAEEIINWMRIAYVCDPVKVNNWVLSVDKKGKDHIFHFLQYAIQFFRSFQRSFHLPDDQIRLSTEEFAHVQKMKSIIDFEKLVAIVDLIDTNYNYVQRNANTKIVLTNMTIKIEGILKG